MIEVIRDYYPAIVIALLIGLIVGYLIFRPRQRVRLSDTAPIRPHMATSKNSPREGNGLAAEAAAAAGDVTGEILGAQVHRQLGQDADDFERLKGVGPKLAQTLRSQGFTRFAQLAGLTGEEMVRLDDQLGAFRGRLTRDRVIEQAHYLARGDQDGFEQTFGKL